MVIFHIQKINKMNKQLMIYLLCFIVISCNKFSGNGIVGNETENKISNEYKDSLSLNNLQKKTITDNIPVSIRNYLTDYLPEFIIPDKIKFIKEVEKYNENNEPNFCSSDFTGDKLNDYVLLLIKENKSYLLIINSSTQGYSHFIIDDFTMHSDSIAIYIRIERRGIWKSIDEALDVKNDGIFIDLIDESLSWSYYWDGTKYKRFLYD